MFELFSIQDIAIALLFLVIGIMHIRVSMLSRKVEEVHFPAESMFDSLEGLTENGDSTVEEIMDEIRMWDGVRKEILSQKRKGG